MRGAGSRFTGAEVATFKRMAAGGYGGVAIAHQLDVSPQAVRALACRLGVRLRRPPLKTKARVVLSTETHRLLQIEAQRRATTARALANQLLLAVLFNDMIGELLPPTKPRFRSPVAQARKGLGYESSRRAPAAGVI